MEARRDHAAPIAPLGQAALPQRPPPTTRRQLNPAHVVAAVIAAVALGLVFHFPLAAMLLLPFAGLAAAVASHWRGGTPIALTLFLSGFLAEVTSIFVTPFTWWMRFGFFLTLIGAYVLFITRQARHL
ncbi:MAG TPA: hypothetical protein VII51_04060 [Gaiellaceae bacterium]